MSAVASGSLAFAEDGGSEVELEHDWPVFTDPYEDCELPNVVSSIDVPIHIRNDGEEDAGAFDVELYWTDVQDWQESDLNLIGTDSFPGLGWEHDAYTQITWDVAAESVSPGPILLVTRAKLQGDPQPPPDCNYQSNDPLWDLDTSNDERVIQFELRPTGRDLEPLELRSVPANPVEDEQATLYCTVRNAGTQDASSPGTPRVGEPPPDQARSDAVDCDATAIAASGARLARSSCRAWSSQESGLGSKIAPDGCTWPSSWTV